MHDLCARGRDSLLRIAPESDCETLPRAAIAMSRTSGSCRRISGRERCARCLAHVSSLPWAAADNGGRDRLDPFAGSRRLRGIPGTRRPASKKPV
jgi:hypothetical protein